jgi:hypothetical protein
MACFFSTFPGDCQRWESHLQPLEGDIQDYESWFGTKKNEAGMTASALRQER